MEVNNRVVWITGASSGIGEALAYQASSHGASVILSARNTANLERVIAGCTDPERHLVLPLDLAEPESFNAAFARVLQRYPGVDVLLNNGGLSQRATALETDLAVVEHLMQVNFFGAVALTKTVLPHMVERASGQIVVISSVLGKVGTPRRSSYAASKHALHGYMDSLRAELWRSGVQISLICPGYIKTNISQNALLGGGEPLGRDDAGEPKGMNVSICATRIMQAIERDKDEAIVAGLEGLAVQVKRFFPAIYNRAVCRVTMT
jgi:dehydrogenase/reductase SDR family protein 7B